MPSPLSFLHDPQGERQPPEREVTSGAQLPGGKAGEPGVSLLGWCTDSVTDSMNVGDAGASQCVLQDTQPVPFSQTGNFSQCCDADAAPVGVEHGHLPIDICTVASQRRSSMCLGGRD